MSAAGGAVGLVAAATATGVALQFFGLVDVVMHDVRVQIPELRKRLEVSDDGAFRDRWFASTSAMFEGEYGDDFFDGNATAFDLDHGDDTGIAILADFITALNTVADDAVYSTLDPLVHWDEVLNEMAVEIFIGHWDGYAPTRNNYFLHFDDAGEMSLLPWGVDQTFLDNLDLYSGQGLLLQRCLDDVACSDAWQAALLRVARAAEALLLDGFGDDVRAQGDRLVEVFEDDPRREWNNDDLPLLADDAVNFMQRRVDFFFEQLVCEAGADTDGDGFACVLDCNEGDPAISYGADEICGNDVDEDCTGLIDDADCGDCILENTPTRPLLFCRQPRNHPEAEATCAANNTMRMVSIVDEDDNFAVLDRARRRFGDAAYWLGLDDEDTEGVYRWSDGRTWTTDEGETTYDRFGGGEPNDYDNNEDCVHMTGDQWNDNNCGASFSVICQP